MGAHYTTNWIVCLASDALGHVEYIEQKRILSKQGLSASSMYPRLPKLPLYPTSRVTIIGHGDEKSTCIMGDGLKWDARQCAIMVKKWFEKNRIKEVKRISFDMCNGAKPSGTDPFRVSDSFVRRFASYCDFAAEVIGRTGVVSRIKEETAQFRKGIEIPGTRKVTAVHRTVDKKVGHALRKVKFLTTGGTISKPKDPIGFLCWNGDVEI
jgi:hypothetical protein